MRILALALCLFIPFQADANPFSKSAKWIKKNAIPAVEHLALGAGTEVAVSQAAGGPQKYGSGLVATGLVAGFKEGADAVASRDSKKKAAFHAVTIIAGAGIMAAARH